MNKILYFIKKIFIINFEGDSDNPTYSDMLGLNKDFEFLPNYEVVTSKAEFDDCVVGAIAQLKLDLKRLGIPFYKIDPGLRNKLVGEIGSMTVIADNDGKVSIKFHKRNKKFLWDGKSKKFPEKDTIGKFKDEIFFSLEEDED